MAAPDVAATPTACATSARRFAELQRDRPCRTASYRTLSRRPRRRGSSPKGEADPEMAAYFRERGRAARRPGRRALAPARALLVPKDPERGQGRDRRDPRRAPAARRRRCGRATSSRCTGGSPSATAGRPTSSRPRPATSAGSRRCRSRFEGKDAFARLKYEAGVHRVQRVPVTESQGRIHTSTATVAVCPRPRRSRSTSGPRTSRSTSTGRAVRAGSRSTPPTRRCASSTSRADQDRDARRSARSCRTGRRRCATSGPGLYQMRARGGAREGGGDPPGAARDGGAVGEDPHLQLPARGGSPITGSSTRRTSSQDVLAGGEELDGFIDRLLAAERAAQLAADGG